MSYFRHYTSYVNCYHYYMNCFRCYTSCVSYCYRCMSYANCCLTKKCDSPKKMMKKCACCSVYYTTRWSCLCAKCCRQQCYDLP